MQGARFSFTITAVPTEAARRHIARIIASSEGFYCSEAETLELLAELPVTLTFEAEQWIGEETLNRLRRAGCDLSYEDETVAPASRDSCGGGQLPGTANGGYIDKQHEKLMERYYRIPAIFLALFIWSLVAAILSHISSAQAFETRMTLRLLIRIIVLIAIVGAVGVRCKEFGGWLVGVAASSLMIAIWGILAIGFLHAHTVQPDIFSMLLFCGHDASCIASIHILTTLLKKSIRGRFK